jgi:hypothetical protein
LAEVPASPQARVAQQSAAKEDRAEKVRAARVRQIAEGKAWQRAKVDKKMDCSTARVPSAGEGEGADEGAGAAEVSSSYGATERLILHRLFGWPPRRGSKSSCR